MARRSLVFGFLGAIVFGPYILAAAALLIVAAVVAYLIGAIIYVAAGRNL